MANVSSKEKLVPVHELQPNMVLSRDLISVNGFLLMPKNTILNTSNLLRLQLLDMGKIYIRVDNDFPSIVTDNPLVANKSFDAEEYNFLPVSEKEDFQIFNSLYTLDQDIVKQHLLSIGNGDHIQLMELYNLTGSMMNELKCRSDVFTYLYHVKSKDNHTYSHSINVSLLCNIFGSWLNMSPLEIEELTVAGLLHDIGKIKIDDNILNKVGRLTREEFEIMKMHTVYGYDILKDSNLSENIKTAVLLHHEKMDGSGYPTHAKSADISKFAKIVSVCDIYDAMTSDRIYRDKLCPFRVIKTFEQQMYGELDTHFLLSFLQNIAYSYLGSRVVLSDNRQGEVVFINKTALSLPIVKVDEKFIDLSKSDCNLYIDRIA